MVEAQRPPTEIDRWRTEVVGLVSEGARLAGLYVSGPPQQSLVIAVVAGDLGLRAYPARLGPEGYPSLTPQVPGAAWYERALHDLSGVMPRGHPRLDPLLLPLAQGTAPPTPGSGSPVGPLAAIDPRAPTNIGGHGVFTIPLGPIRSGVMESVELLIETVGEDIPHLGIRPHFKHRGIAKAFEGKGVDDAVLVAERVEGIATVAHALAFSHAVEASAHAQVPRRAGLLRVVYAELERIAWHLEVTAGLCDAAGLSVAISRFTAHQEQVRRLLSAMCGSRFARSVVVPGGVSRDLEVDAQVLRHSVGKLVHKIRADVQALGASASFLDRLRGTGVLAGARAQEFGAVGPVGRGSGTMNDVRTARPYDGYLELPPPVTPTDVAGDALSRARVRWHEIATSNELIQEALLRLPETPADLVARAGSGEPVDGVVLGSAESGAGEVVYGLELNGGLVRRCFARSASFHNLALLPEVFHGDVYTDLPFIEASFGLSYAGSAM